MSKLLKQNCCKMRRRSALRVFWAVCCVTVLLSPGDGCLSKEYELADGQCCPMCHEGSVVRRDCTPLWGRRCVPCVDGTFMNQPNGRTKCFPCSSCDQGGGLFAQHGCTLTRDTVCDVIAGYFCERLMEDNGCSSARRHSRCAAGERIKEHGTRRTDTTCEPCPAGSFSVEGVNCTLWSTCSETQVKVEEGSPTSDAICGPASNPIPIVLGILSVILLTLATGILVFWIIRKKGLKTQQQITKGHRSSEPRGEEEAVCLAEVTSREEPPGLVEAERRPDRSETKEMTELQIPRRPKTMAGRWLEVESTETSPPPPDYASSLYACWNGGDIDHVISECYNPSHSQQRGDRDATSPPELVLARAARGEVPKRTHHS